MQDACHNNVIPSLPCCHLAGLQLPDVKAQRTRSWSMSTDCSSVSGLKRACRDRHGAPAVCSSCCPRYVMEDIKRSHDEHLSGSGPSCLAQLDPQRIELSCQVKPRAQHHAPRSQRLLPPQLCQHERHQDIQACSGPCPA